jgi:hypothetical protein
MLIERSFGMLLSYNTPDKQQGRLFFTCISLLSPDNHSKMRVPRKSAGDIKNRVIMTDSAVSECRPAAISVRPFIQHGDARDHLGLLPHVPETVLGAPEENRFEAFSLFVKDFVIEVHLADDDVVLLVGSAGAGFLQEVVDHVWVRHN